MFIPFQGQITERDLARIFTLALKSQRWLTYVFGPLFFISIIMMAIGIYTHTFNTFSIMMLVFTGVMASYPFWGPSTSARTTYKNQSEMRGSFVGAFNDEGLLLNTSKATQNIKWAAYTHIVRDSETVLLFQNAQCFNFFPRAFFATDAEWQEFQTMLDGKIQRGELKEQTGSPKMFFGLSLPLWMIIAVLALLAIQAMCLLGARFMVQLYQAGQ